MKTTADKGHKSRAYILQRTPEETMTNAYNPDILKAWKANMDIQVIGSVHGAARYITNYIAKEESADVRQAIESE